MRKHGRRLRGRGPVIREQTKSADNKGADNEAANNEAAEDGGRQAQRRAWAGIG
jgi:hypothetical protein